MGSAGGNNEPVSEESTCSDEGSLLEPPLPPPETSTGAGPDFQGWEGTCASKPEDVC